MSEAPEPWAPAFEGQRPPFEPGNQLAAGRGRPAIHSAYSPRRVEPLATELVQLVLGQATVDGSPVTYLLDPTYLPSLWAYARAEATEQLLHEYLADVGGPIDGKGKVRPAADLLERVARRCERLRARLGLDPLSRASLARDLAVAQTPRSIEDLKRAGRELLAELDRRTEVPAGHVEEEVL